MHDIEQAVEELREAEHHPREIHFTVDGEEYETTKRELTPNEIISEFGKKDPATNYLVEIKGNHKISFQGKGDEEIQNARLHELPDRLDGSDAGVRPYWARRLH